MSRAPPRRGPSKLAAAGDAEAAKKKQAQPQPVRKDLVLSVKESDIHRIQELSIPRDIVSAVAGLSNQLSDWECSLNHAGMLDQYISLLWRCKELGLPDWLSAFAFTMLGKLFVVIREGGTHEQVRSAFAELGKLLAESSQAHAVSSTGAAASKAFLAQCKALMEYVYGSVIKHYELLRFVFLEKPDVVRTKKTLEIYTLTPSGLTEDDAKTVPPILQIGLEEELLTRASRTIEETAVQISPKKGGDKRGERKSAAPAQAAQKGGKKKEESRPPSKPTQQAKPQSQAKGAPQRAPDPVDAEAAELDRLLEKFSSDHVKAVAAALIKEVLEEYEQKVTTTLEAKQQKLQAKLEAAGRQGK